MYSLHCRFLALDRLNITIGPIFICKLLAILCYTAYIYLYS
uniref:Uncharacterized protein n=1 Tax=Arundo donax TaxID=35708 RepID=A0A0A9B2R0_ARUDO